MNANEQFHPGPAGARAAPRNVSDPMRSTYACLIMDMVIVSSATQPMPLATKPRDKGEAVAGPTAMAPGTAPGSTPDVT